MKDPTFELIEMMFKLSRLMKDEMSFSNNFLQLSALQIQTLFHLDHNGVVTMSDIAGYLHIELPSATSLVTKLHTKKLIVRSADAKDRRIVMITLTPEGKSLLVEAVKERRKKMEKALSYLTPDEKIVLLGIFNSLKNRLPKVV